MNLELVLAHIQWHTKTFFVFPSVSIFFLVSYLKHHHCFLYYWSNILQGSPFSFACLKDSANYIKMSLWKLKYDHIICTFKMLWWLQWFHRVKYKLLGKILHTQDHTFYSIVDLKPFSGHFLSKSLFCRWFTLSIWPRSSFYLLFFSSLSDLHADQYPTFTESLWTTFRGATLVSVYVHWFYVQVMATPTCVTEFWWHLSFINFLVNEEIKIVVIGT